MASRPRLRPQAAGLWYHIGTRGVRKLPIVQDDDDRTTFLAQVEDVVKRFGWELTAF